MIKRKIPKDGIINLKPSDLNHTGNNMRYFELVAAEELVEKENLSKLPDPVKKEINDLISEAISAPE